MRLLVSAFATANAIFAVWGWFYELERINTFLSDVSNMRIEGWISLSILLMWFSWMWLLLDRPLHVWNFPWNPSVSRKLKMLSPDLDRHYEKCVDLAHRSDVAPNDASEFELNRSIVCGGLDAVGIPYPEFCSHEQWARFMFGMKILAADGDVRNAMALAGRLEHAGRETDCDNEVSG